MPSSLTPTRPHGSDEPPEPTSLEPTSLERPAPPAVRPLLWVVGALLMTVLMATIVAAAMLIAADDGSIETTTVEPAAEVTEAEPVAPATGDAVALGGNAMAVEATPAELAQAFAVAWSTGDWDAVASLSNPAVTETARNWYAEGLAVTVVEPVQDQGGELLVADPASPPAVIFNLRFDGDGMNRSVGALDFGGDAGDSGWPEGGTSNDGPSSAAPTQALVITEPAPGAVFTSGDVVRGVSNADAVEFRLSASSIELATGTAPVVDGTFELEIEFSNTCCIEMTLRVSHADGSSATLMPLSYPEPG